MTLGQENTREIVAWEVTLDPWHSPYLSESRITKRCWVAVVSLLGEARWPRSKFKHIVNNNNRTKKLGDRCAPSVGGLILELVLGKVG